MGKTVWILLTLSVVLLFAAAVSYYLGSSQPEIAQANEAEFSVLRFEKSERWFVIAGMLTLIASALGLAGIKLWIQNRADARQLSRSML